MCIYLISVWVRQQETPARNLSKSYVEPSLPGRGRAVPLTAPLHAPRSPSSPSAPVLSPGSPRVDVWGGRGTAAMPRWVRWRTIEPTPSGAYRNRHSRGGVIWTPSPPTPPLPSSQYLVLILVPAKDFFAVRSESILRGTIVKIW